MDPKNEGLNMNMAVNKAESHNQLEHLAIGIVHEIRNPLTTIKGFLQLLKPYLKEAGKEQYADVILDEINRTNDIVYEFLNAAKQKNNLSRDIPLNKIIQDMVLLFESEAILKNVKFITTLANHDIILSIPANYLKQVLINLMKNAIEAMNEGSSRVIHISTIHNGGSALISISDSGCGMTDERMNNLFIPFHSAKEAGTGVGLWVSKKIIEDFSGSIRVNSKLGEGTTFTIELPVK